MAFEYLILLPPKSEKKLKVLHDVLAGQPGFKGKSVYGIYEFGLGNMEEPFVSVQLEPGRLIIMRHDSRINIWKGLEELRSYLKQEMAGFKVQEL